MAFWSKKGNEKDGMLQRLRKSLSKTREGFTDRIDSLFLTKSKIDEELLDELEEILITSDIGITTTNRLIEKIKEKVKRKELNSVDSLKDLLKNEMYFFLHEVEKSFDVDQDPPFVIMVVGVNGVGKTTSIAKLAYMFKKEGKSVLIGAADTFRAAATNQLDIWTKRVGCDIVKHQDGSDPSAVAYDTIHAAIHRKIDVVIMDTAGRQHTNINLMEELKKMKRIIHRELPVAPHETLLILDATTGQNAVSQAKMFEESLGVSGIAITKLDGTAKGGVIVGLSMELKTPIRFIGIGEKLDDLSPFNAMEFANSIIA